MQETDPEGVEIRASKRLVRRAYFAKGPNYISHIDGYDKLKPFGLCISGSIDGFSSRIIWLNVYNTNNNPRIIGRYFLESVKQIRGSPCIVIGDCGTENGHVRDFQTFFHRNSSFGNVYMSGASTCNQRIESWWGFLRRECTQFWIELFRSMEEEGLYNGDFLDKNLVQFCFMALIQDELDDIAEIWNTHKIRPSRNQNWPSGRPDLMYFTPMLWGSEDYLCSVPDEELYVCAT
ncbi:hypothetical protein KUTeg_021226 [Tegillarca granosa]|uniref:Integrase core domain-containing protein n=1 Tax=Tegillarca granosa TaxID=220873 RepID=A0ABQ9EA60_TEGGR|nr:hypothetical protein KUTeg_021226 [Tegillarca granosa]